MPGWHVPELAKGVAYKVRHSQALGRATGTCHRESGQ